MVQEEKLIFWLSWNVGIKAKRKGMVPDTDSGIFFMPYIYIGIVMI
jgi:hypothetical protein